MKKILVTVVGLLCAGSLLVQAQDAKPKHEGKGHAKMTEEQKAEYKKLVDKYDTNKDGKLDKEERSKMSKEDKQAMAKLFPHKKDGAKEGKEKKKAE